MEVYLRSEASSLRRKSSEGVLCTMFSRPSLLESCILHGCCEISVGFAQLFLLSEAG